MRVERRAYNAQGNFMPSEEQRANPDSLIPDGCPPEFQAKIKMILGGHAEAAAVEFDERTAERRDRAAERLREVAAQL